MIKFRVCPIESFQTNADRSRHIGLPSVPECFSRALARGGRKYGNTSFASVARAGHNTDMTDTGKRARKTSGNQGSSLHDTGEKRSEQIVKHTCIRLDFRRSLVSGIRSSPRGRNAGSFTRTAAVNQWSLYTECKYGGPLGRRPGRVMKVRLVRPRCFVLTMLPLKSLASWTG